MDMTNDCYRIVIRFGDSSEEYCRDEGGWVKTSTRGRQFRMTAEQVLNHLLPALAGIKQQKMTVVVEYRGKPLKKKAKSL